MTMFLRDTPDRTAMHKENFVSVAIASNDRFDLLHRAIDSVHKHADMPFEIVVSDDAGHRHPDLSVFQFRDKVSRIVINTGFNQGLAVNANQAIGATRGRNVIFLSDDSLILRPFMREVFNALDDAPYVGVLYLGQTYNANAEFPAVGHANGLIQARTCRSSRLLLHCQHGSSWANAFRKSYWHEVGGYSEDDAYGDLPFINKGWLRGYFSAALEGPQIAIDMDVAEFDKTRGSVSFQAHGALCHYPKLFGVPEKSLIEMGRERNAQCTARNHLGRRDIFNEFDCREWGVYMKEATRETANLDALSRHRRFAVELKRDLEF